MRSSKELSMLIIIKSMIAVLRFASVELVIIKAVNS